LKFSLLSLLLLSFSVLAADKSGLQGILVADFSVEQKLEGSFELKMAMLRQYSPKASNG
jgi:hypothetical protein